MRVVDTSAWIEGFIRGHGKSVIRQELPQRESCVVPTIVQLELAKWMTRNLPEDVAARVIAYTIQCVVIDLKTSIAIRAAELWQQYKLATADAIVYATALEAGADLLTCDAHFKDLPGVVYFARSQD